MNTSDLSLQLLGKRSIGAYPNTAKIAEIIKNIRVALFPEHFQEICGSESSSLRHETLLAVIRRDLAEETNDETATRLLDVLPHIQQLLYKDAQAGFDGDPAAYSVDEIILTYPGFYAVFIYRIAHFLFTENVPLIPRIMTEYAHSITGIDIHPGATIGEYFFIDHGTGVVIGETSVIGDHVKIYQGVTIGALSTRKGQGLKNVKRHPTVGDYVTIYSGASILGGDTFIGDGAVIGGNAFIVESVPANTKAGKDK